MNDGVPLRLVHDSGGPEVEWMRTDGARFVEPFFTDTIARLACEHPGSRRTHRTRTPLDRLRETSPGVPPTAFILHVSRCGSTLVSRMLAALARNIVVSEPPIVDDLIRMPHRDPAITAGQQIEWLRGAVRAFGASRAGAGRLFVKLDCWHILHLPLIARAFPAVPLLFVHRAPLEVLVSLMRRPSLTLVRDTIAPEQLGLTAAERDALDPEEHAAAILGAFFRAALTHRTRLIPIGYEGLPSAALDQLSALEFTATERDQMIAAALQDAKHPTERFVPDSGRKHEVVTPALRAAFDRWTKQPYEQWLASL